MSKPFFWALIALAPVVLAAHVTLAATEKTPEHGAVHIQLVPAFQALQLSSIAEFNCTGT
jgi:hypothetical protein